MFKRLIAGCVILLVVLVGCQESVKKNSETKEFVPVIGSPADYIVKAVDVTGGSKAWEKADRIKLKAVVAMYESDGSYYLTEHNYKIQPWEDKIEISCIEPSGDASCVLSKGAFNMLKGSDNLYTLPSELNADLYSEMVLDITTAAIRLLDNQFVFAKKDQLVKREGILYSEIDRQQVTNEKSLPRRKATFLQNVDKNIVDMIAFSEQEDYVVRGYDYRRIAKDSVLLPAQIEIFSCDKNGYLKRKLVKIDFKL